ncbi:HNH endonuclease signature motif containing protein [Burkholderia multivorans]|uniref:HNH endonuclease signature motif containing protein n=1 Tax=Burkholderia multivorans TaxID=87883 RepID=UPI0021C09CEF|nr:HNH endonuclease signature motif containing protein [Burkholderia multivorans]
MITLDELKSIVEYDQETGLFTWIKTRSYKHLIGKRSGSLQVNGYVAITINKKKYLAHRLAWLYVHGSEPPECIDHINGNRSDNRICNLRLATKKENNHNTHQFSENKAGYTGISWAKRQKKWRARIKVDGKEKYLGYFTSKEEAHAAYLDAKRKYHPFFSK